MRLLIAAGHSGIRLRVEGATETEAEAFQPSDTGSSHTYTGNKQPTACDTQLAFGGIVYGGGVVRRMFGGNFSGRFFYA